MRYLAVQWHHKLANEPVWLYYELDGNGSENRKVEVYMDGTHDWAAGEEGTGSTWISGERVPTSDEIAADPQFTPREISRDEFEVVWRKAKGHAA